MKSLTTGAAETDVRLADADERTRALAALWSAFSRRDRPRRIAVVGNAPQEPDARRAADIDDCDLVVRVNGFVLDDPESTPTYGRRCDIALLTRGIFPPRHVFQGYSRRLTMLFEPDRMVDGDGGGRGHRPEWWPADLGVLHLPNNPFTVLSSRELGFDAYRQLRWATTGTMAVWLAAHLFPDTTVVLSGFSFVADPWQVDWGHATGEVCVVAGGAHELLAESLFVRRLVARGRARFALEG